VTTPGSSKNQSPRLYTDLAEWFHLLTAPEDYREEAAFYRRVITENSLIPVKTVLELGSGGGNNASHMKAHFTMTLTDLSEDMLAISRRLNPECEHIQGDMRHIRLSRQFDAVFIHDAIGYMTSINDLAMAIETAFLHCRPGGVALFTPNFTRETFSASTRHGGHDSGNRGVRHIEWTHDPDPGDTSYIVDMAYLLREGENVRCEYDRHVLGLFSEADWYKLITGVGLTSVKKVPYPDNIDKTGLTPVFIGVCPGYG
jgi:SAM-dependent methyltransferase